MGAELAGAGFFWLLLFLYGLANNLNFSYMGNTSSEMVSYVFQNFAGEIARFLLLLICCYLVLALVWMLFVWRCVGILPRLSGLKKRWRFAAGAGLSALLYLPMFFGTMVMYPQMYISGWYQKGPLRAGLMDIACSITVPWFWFALLAVIVCGVIAADCILSFLRGRRLVCAVWGVLLCLVTAACWAGARDIPARPAADDRPSVLVLASDALRPDHLGAYGYERATSPAIDSLINQGVSFHDLKIEVPRHFPHGCRL